MGSPKLVWGYDSFEGFPDYHENDRLAKFDELFADNLIDQEIYQKVKLNQEYRTLVLNAELSTSNISTSGNFEENPLDLLQKKIQFLQLDNIRLVKGNFLDTLVDNGQNDSDFCACLLDCNLYESHKLSLDYVWPKLHTGGYVCLDDYYSLKFPGAKIAVDEFFADKKDKPQMHELHEGEFQRWFVRKIFG